MLYTSDARPLSPFVHTVQFDSSEIRDEGSTRKGGGTTTMSRTSTATPHVAGTALLGAVGSDGSACSDGNPAPIAHL